SAGEDDVHEREEALTHTDHDVPEGQERLDVREHVRAELRPGGARVEELLAELLHALRRGLQEGYELVLDQRHEEVREDGDEARDDLDLRRLELPLEDVQLVLELHEGPHGVARHDEAQLTRLVPELGEAFGALVQRRDDPAAELFAEDEAADGRLL